MHMMMVCGNLSSVYFVIAAAVVVVVAAAAITILLLLLVDCYTVAATNISFIDQYKQYFAESRPC